MSSADPTIFLSVAEESGDLHASWLIRSLRRRWPGARFVGAAGPHMVAEGCESLVDLTQRAAMLGGPVRQLGWWIAQVRRLQQSVREIRPDLVIPTDSPALNWHIAKAGKQAGIPVLYYIAPQVWGWATWRVRKLARLTDRVACILPFEEAYLRRRGVSATFVGHPLAEQIPAAIPDPPDLADGWFGGNWRIALLPGSRSGEVRANAPLLARTAEVIRRRWPRAECTWACHKDESAELLGEVLGGALRWPVVAGRTHQVLAQSHFALAVSGTVTLEAAFFGVPMVIVYRSSWFDRLAYRALVRHIIHTRWFALVNILAGRELVPEIIPAGGNPAPVIDTALEVMHDYGYLVETRRQLRRLVHPLQNDPARSASDRAADLAVELLNARA